MILTNKTELETFLDDSNIYEPIPENKTTEMEIRLAVIKEIYKRKMKEKGDK